MAAPMPREEPVTIATLEGTLELAGEAVAWADGVEEVELFMTAPLCRCAAVSCSQFLSATVIHILNDSLTRLSPCCRRSCASWRAAAFRRRRARCACRT